jgi:hypothetical protein
LCLCSVVRQIDETPSLLFLCQVQAFWTTPPQQSTVNQRDQLSSPASQLSQGFTLSGIMDLDANSRPKVARGWWDHLLVAFEILAASAVPLGCVRHNWQPVVIITRGLLPSVCLPLSCSCLCCLFSAAFPCLVFPNLCAQEANHVVSALRCRRDGYPTGVKVWSPPVSLLAFFFSHSTLFVQIHRCVSHDECRPKLPGAVCSTSNGCSYRQSTIFICKVKP